MFVDDNGAIHYSAYRVAANWLPTNLLSIDMDSSPLSMFSFVEKYGEGLIAMAYETTSSTPDSPRFRLIFRTDRNIQRAENYRKALAVLSSRWLGIDPTSIDIVKAYGGGKLNGDVYVDPSAILKIDKLVEWIREWEKQREVERKRTNKPTKIIVDDNTPGARSADEIAEMLRFMPEKSEYGFWLKIVMSVYSMFPNEIGIELIESRWQCKKNEVQNMFRSFGRRGTTIGPGWLVTVAKSYGWRPTQTPKVITDYYNQVLNRVSTFSNNQRQSSSARPQYTN